MLEAYDATGRTPRRRGCGVEMNVRKSTTGRESEKESKKKHTSESGHPASPVFCRKIMPHWRKVAGEFQRRE